jgi:hypothetical protein
MLNRLRRWVLGPLAILLLAVSSEQSITRGYIYSEVGTLWSWTASAPSWSGSLQTATYTDFTTYVANDGSCGGSPLESITYGAATTCGVLYSQQTVNIPVATSGTTGFSPTVVSATYPVSLSNGTATCNSTATTTASFTITIKNVGGTAVISASGGSTDGSAYSSTGFGSDTTDAPGNWSYVQTYLHTGGGCSGTATLVYSN